MPAFEFQSTALSDGQPGWLSVRPAGVAVHTPHGADQPISISRVAPGWHTVRAVDTRGTHVVIVAATAWAEFVAALTLIDTAR